MKLEIRITGRTRIVELERHDAEGARLVKLRYFAGFTHQDAAHAMGLSRGQADRLWAFAKAWLYQKMNDC